mmetsp:Transcript_73052/g.116517  ORF Transcript_73052/g.116517 Transcript_73052/m.116517 type:complete len:316 (+) Transcript_73052:1862-2809(+)
MTAVAVSPHTPCSSCCRYRCYCCCCWRSWRCMQRSCNSLGCCCCCCMAHKCHCCCYCNWHCSRHRRKHCNSHIVHNTQQHCCCCCDCCSCCWLVPVVHDQLAFAQTLRQSKDCRRQLAMAANTTRTADCRPAASPSGSVSRRYIVACLRCAQSTPSRVRLQRSCCCNAIVTRLWRWNRNWSSRWSASMTWSERMDVQTTQCWIASAVVCTTRRRSWWTWIATATARQRWRWMARQWMRRRSMEQGSVDGNGWWLCVWKTRRRKRQIWNWKESETTVWRKRTTTCSSCTSCARLISSRFDRSICTFCRSLGIGTLA